MSDGGDAHALLSWRPRLTIRWRLTLTYAVLVTGCGAVLIAVVWIFMRFVPQYAISVAPTTMGPATPATAGSTRLSTSATMDPDAVDAFRAGSLSVRSEWDFLQLLLLISVAALLVLAVLSGFVGWIVAGRVLRPLQAINTAATLAAAGSLDHRVGLQGPHDEIRSLSDTFDRMLGSLGRSFDAHRRFAANASHELRTPLATVQTMIDVTLADPEADADDLRALAARVRTVNSANLRTVESLLELADIRQGRLGREPVDLRGVISEVVRAIGAEAEDGAVTIRVLRAFVSRPTVVLGDSVLLRQCLGNLVQNAVRHNHRGGRVEVRVFSTDDTVTVAVTNTGERVPDELVATLVEPFVRGGGRTSGRTGVRGHGLGLAIAVSVADAHGGTVALRANPGGGMFAELRLPRSAAAGEDERAVARTHRPHVRRLRSTSRDGPPAGR